MWTKNKQHYISPINIQYNSPILLQFNEVPISQVNVQKVRGVLFIEQLTWATHVTK